MTLHPMLEGPMLPKVSSGSTTLVAVAPPHKKLPKGKADPAPKKTIENGYKDTQKTISSPAALPANSNHKGTPEAYLIHRGGLPTTNLYMPPPSDLGQESKVESAAPAHTTTTATAAATPEEIRQAPQRTWGQKFMRVATAGLAVTACLGLIGVMVAVPGGGLGMFAIMGLICGLAAVGGWSGAQALYNCLESVPPPPPPVEQKAANESDESQEELSYLSESSKPLQGDEGSSLSPAMSRSNSYASLQVLAP